MKWCPIEYECYSYEVEEEQMENENDSECLWEVVNRIMPSSWRKMCVVVLKSLYLSSKDIGSTFLRTLLNTERRAETYDR
jgi:hypothetical protein